MYSDERDLSKRKFLALHKKKLPSENVFEIFDRKCSLEAAH